MNFVRKHRFAVRTGLNQAGAQFRQLFFGVMWQQGLSNEC